MGSVKIKQNNKTQSDSVLDGITLAFTFSISSLFLFLNNTYFESIIVSQILAALLGMSGAIGFSIEISRLIPKNNNFINSDLSLGTLFLTFFIILNKLLPFLIIKIIAFVGLMFAIYGIVRGIMIIFKNIISKRNSRGDFYKIFFSFICQIATLIFTSLQILKILKIIE